MRLPSETVTNITMKQTTYRMTLSDGSKSTKIANSAAEAIESAIWETRGETVAECHAGFTKDEAEVQALVTGKACAAAIIRFEVPMHSAISADEVQKKRARKVDATEPMFDEDEIKRESEQAISRR